MDMADDDNARHPRQRPDPTPDEIAVQCAAIQKTWTRRERYWRGHGVTELDPYTERPAHARKGFGRLHSIGKQPIGVTVPEYPATLFFPKPSVIDEGIDENNSVDHDYWGTS